MPGGMDDGAFGCVASKPLFQGTTGLIAFGFGMGGVVGRGGGVGLCLFNPS